ncbi:DUF2878 domain-containing protein [Aliidiomarina maris]|uniref:DUF2878 domain-containing protein n=1 Tax=Aliidiomarina maris TaxID=531312 RepID=UPI001300AF21|nr:DUF2878 domain-containing protein [Aliidiomarina maris]
MRNQLSQITRLVHFFFFDLVWFLAVWGREDWLWLTALSVVALYASAWRYLWARRYMLITLIGVGLLAEYLMVAMGAIRFTGTDLLPAWLILLWLGFAAMALVVFTWLKGRYVLAFIAGVIFGPITYFAGVGLGAAERLTSPMLMAVGYSLIWGLLMLLVVRMVALGQDKEQRYV